MIKIRLIQDIPLVVQIDYEPIKNGILQFHANVIDGTSAILYHGNKEQLLCFENGIAEANGIDTGNYRLIFPHTNYPILLNVFKFEGSDKKYARVRIGSDYDIYNWLIKILVSMDDMIQEQNEKINNLIGYRTE